MKYDITLLTDPRYLIPKENDTYTDEVILEDKLVSDALEGNGLKVTRISWDDPNFDWSSTRFAMFRAVWDYFDRLDEFMKWYGKTSELTTFINSKKLIDWNIDKHYFKDLMARGINIPKTLFVEPGEKLNLLEALDKAMASGFRSDTFVLKPCIAGGAYHTYKFHHSEWEQYDAIFRKLIRAEAMMLQEFQKNIVDEGEVSMMVTAGKFTHAILKKAKKGDFRVQNDYGGSVSNYLPSAEEIAFAERVCKACDELPMYGRADIFKDNDGQIALAELEIFEPELWFRFYPKAAKTLSESIAKKYFS